MAALRGEAPDRIPWLIYPGTFARPYPARLDILRRSPLWRELRPEGLGLRGGAAVYREVRPHVEVRAVREGNMVITTYQTPVGSVSMKDRKLEFSGSPMDWRMEFPIKELQDYEVVKFIAEDTEYLPNYEAFTAAEREMDGDGIVITRCQKSPLQEIIYRLMGYRRFAIELYTHQKKLDELIEVLGRSKGETYHIVASRGRPLRRQH